MNQTWIDELPRFKGLAFDIEALKGLAHRCDPLLCRKGPSCCGCYEITLKEREIDRLVPYLGEASELASGVKRESDFENIFEEVERGLFALDTDEAGLCLLACRDSEGRTLCSLHSVALKHGIEPHRVKPFNCWLWPLSLTDSRPKILTVQEDAVNFPCNRRRTPSEKGIDEGVEEIIRTLFGQEAVEFVEKWT